MLICPHCATQIPEHASVCVGCGAEIVRGATVQERSMAGCFFTVLVLLIAMAIAGMQPMPDPHDDAALFLVLRFLGLAVIANIVGRVAMGWLHRSKLRFLRTYQHQ